MSQWPRTLGELKQTEWADPTRRRSVKDELRANLIRRLQSRQPLFSGVLGYQDTVIPQIVNAVLARHNFIRLLTTLLDDAVPFVQGSETRDDPFHPISKFARELLHEKGDHTPIDWLTPADRYVEKLATPDVTIADMIGDLDPIKAAKTGRHMSDELNIHFGLLPRANRGLFAINELPDLAGKIQVGLFNIMQEGDVQIKGYPVRLALDVMLVFTANPEDYTARGKIVTPLKDRIGSEIRTHYPLELGQGVAITKQEAWTDRDSPLQIFIPEYLRESIEQIAFTAREDKKVDRRSGVSQRMPITVLETVVSNAERRALAAGDKIAVPRVLDLYSALPAITGKLELEYEGELRGGETVARDLVRASVGRVFSNHLEGLNLNQIVQFFELGGTLKLEDHLPAKDLAQQLDLVPGLMEKTAALGIGRNEPDAVRAAAAEFILEGLYAHKRITRSEEMGFMMEERKRDTAEEPPRPRGKRQQFN
jgi:magnesium chelatase subunit I